MPLAPPVIMIVRPLSEANSDSARSGRRDMIYIVVDSHVKQSGFGKGGVLGK